MGAPHLGVTINEFYGQTECNSSDLIEWRSDGASTGSHVEEQCQDIALR